MPAPEIRIEGKPVFLFGDTGFDHLYLVLVLEDGRELVLRAGPEGDLGTGNIVFEISVPMEDSADSRPPELSFLYGSRVLDLEGRDPLAVWALMEQLALGINQAHIPFLTFIQNSNSSIATLLYMAGIDIADVMPDQPDQTDDYPASDVLLDMFNWHLQGAAEDDYIRGASGNDNFAGDGGNDWLIGGSGTNQLYGGDGNDRLDGGDDDDFIAGGDGQDTIRGGGGNDTLFAGLGNDNVAGGDGDDYIAGSGGHNIIWAGYGNDTVQGGPGSETIYGGAGHNELSGNDGWDLIYAGTDGDILRGGRGHDTLIGNIGNDTIHGGDGNDLMYGGGGNDLIRAYNTYSGNGSTIRGGDGDDTIHGGYRNDNIGGGTGNDVIYCFEGQNTVWGGYGDDRIVDGVGIDILNGGPGADTFVFLNYFWSFPSNYGGHDVITDFTPGADLIDLSRLGAAFNGGDGLIAGVNSFFYDISSGQLIGDLNGDGTTDWIIELTGAPAITSADLLL